MKTRTLQSERVENIFSIGGWDVFVMGDKSHKRMNKEGGWDIYDLNWRKNETGKHLKKGIWQLYELMSTQYNVSIYI